jgi:hypothetical protein
MALRSIDNTGIDLITIDRDIPRRVMANKARRRSWASLRTMVSILVSRSPPSPTQRKKPSHLLKSNKGRVLHLSNMLSKSIGLWWIHLNKRNKKERSTIPISSNHMRSHLRSLRVMRRCPMKRYLMRRYHSRRSNNLRSNNHMRRFHMINHSIMRNSNSTSNLMRNSNLRSNLMISSRIMINSHRGRALLAREDIGRLIPTTTSSPTTSNSIREAIRMNRSSTLPPKRVLSNIMIIMAWKMLNMFKMINNITTREVAGVVATINTLPSSNITRIMINHYNNSTTRNPNLPSIKRVVVVLNNIRNLIKIMRESRSSRIERGDIR